MAHFQIVLIILLKGLIKSNVNTNMMVKNVKLVKSNAMTEINLLNAQTLKII